MNLPYYCRSWSLLAELSKLAKVIENDKERKNNQDLLFNLHVLHADLSNDFCSISINYVFNTYDIPLKAAQHGAKECVHWLLQKRASPNIRDGKFL